MSIKKKEKPLSNLMKYFFSVVMMLITYLMLEMLMIVLEPYLFRGFYQYDSDLGFRVRPYMSGANLFGFNDQDYSFEKPEGMIRVLFVSDSFGWVGGRDGNYTTILERKLEKHYGMHRVDIINSGYPMTHTGEQLAMFKKYGLQYRPDIVFLGFFVGNDFVDADPHRKRIVVNDTYFDIDRRDEKTLLGYPIIAKSRLWYFIKQKIIVWRSVIKPHSQEIVQTQQENAGDKGCTFSEEAYLDITRQRLEFCNIQSQRSGIYKKNIDFIFQSLSQMQALTARNEMRFIVGIFPDEFQVNEALQLQVFRRFGLDRGNYDLELPQRLLSEYLEANQIPYLDLLDVFRARGKIEPLYLCRDTHWNQAGIELAANNMFQYLISLLAGGNSQQ